MKRKGLRKSPGEIGWVPTKKGKPTKKGQTSQRYGGGRPAKL